MIIAIVVFIQISLYLFSASQISAPLILFTPNDIYEAKIKNAKHLPQKLTHNKVTE